MSKREYFDYESIRDRVRLPYGKLVVPGMFQEFNRGREGEMEPIFSFKAWNRTYLDIADPTEYETAMVLIGNWEHWQAVRLHQITGPVMDEWANEVEIKLRSQGVRNVISLAGSTAPGAAGAAQWLAKGGYIEDSRLRTKKGREKEEKVQEAIKRRVADDAARINLKTDKTDKE